MLLTIIAFIVILGLLVFVHEFGHFITAKKSGVNVEEFGFGFPPRIFGIKKGETLYSINWIPLGGFVKIKGEDGEKRSEPDSFGFQPFWKKGLILSAGVLMNIFLAFIIISLSFMLGMPTALDEQDLSRFKVSDLKIQITDVVDQSPAQAAGLKAGYQIVSVNQKNFQTVEQLQNYVFDHPDEDLSIGYLDNKNQLQKTIARPTLLNSESPDKKVLGVNLVQMGMVKFGFWESWYRGLLGTFNMLIAIILAFYNLFKNLFIGQGLSADVAGPVGLAALTGQMVGLGFGYVLRFTAILSLNLAVLNFLPFPALDGGRFVGVLVEKIRRKPNNQKVEAIIHSFGFSLLMVAFVLITYRDVAKYGSGFLSKIKDLF